MAKLSDLPNELLRYIFLMLSLEDRKLVALVSRRWRKVGEDPVLWKWCIIVIHNADDISKLSHRRFQYVQEIYVEWEAYWNTQQLEDLLKATLELPKLKIISGLQCLDLSSVNSELLVRAIIKLEELYLIASHRTTNNQRSAIFNEMLEKGSIRKLKLINVNLFTLKLEAELLAKIISRLDELKVVSPSLTNQQVRAIFTELSRNCKLKYLHLALNDLSSVDRDDLATVVTKIEDVNLVYSRLKTEQITAILKRAQQNTNLKRLSIVGNRITRVEPALVATAREVIELVVDSDGSDDDESDSESEVEISNEDIIDDEESDEDEIDSEDAT